MSYFTDLFARFLDAPEMDAGGRVEAGRPHIRNSHMFKDDSTRRQETSSDNNGHPPGNFKKKLRWLIQTPPKTPVRWTITPAMAEEMLTWNWGNRPLTESIMRDYARAIAAGRWVYTGDTVKFSDAGRLVDGQKRLTACVLAGKPFETEVVFGVPDNAFAFMDRGQGRTASHIFAIHGVKSHALMAAASQWVAGYEAGAMKTASYGKLPIDLAALYEFYLEHERLQESAWVGSAFAKNRLAPPSIMTALHYLCANKARGQSDEFFRKLGDGLFDTKKHAGYKLYQRLISNAQAQEKLGRKSIAAITIKAWNAHRLGRSAGALEFGPDEIFPKVI